MVKSLITFVAPFAICSVMGGCASIIRGTTQTIAISTPPTTGAACNLSSPAGNWHLISPGIASVEKSRNNIRVHCDKPGWNSAIASIPSNFEGWTLGNLLFGGLIGVGVDAATGAINEYPDDFQVPMTQSAAIPQQGDSMSRPSPPAVPLASAPAVSIAPRIQPPAPDVASRASTPAATIAGLRTEAPPAPLVGEQEVVLFPVTIYHRYHPSWRVDVQ